jgi:hypothetical protein
MAAKPTAPKTIEEALGKGYRHVADVSTFANTRLGMSHAAFAQLRTQYQTANGVDCTTAPDGTLCFDSWRNGQHVVGYCQNGSCNIVSGDAGQG